MSKSRKERREAAAKAARTIQPVAVAGTVADKLRVAYNHIESIERENEALLRMNREGDEDYAELEQKAHDHIESMARRTYKVAVACGAAGLLLGAVLALLPW